MPLGLEEANPETFGRCDKAVVFFVRSRFSETPDLPALGIMGYEAQVFLWCTNPHPMGSRAFF